MPEMPEVRLGLKVQDLGLTAPAFELPALSEGLGLRA